MQRMVLTVSAYVCCGVLHSIAALSTTTRRNVPLGSRGLRPEVVHLWLLPVRVSLST